MVYQTKIFCPQQVRDVMVDQAKMYGLTVTVKYPEFNKDSLDISYTKHEIEQHDQYLSQYEHDPDYIIFYDPIHKKGMKKPFRVNTVQAEGDREYGLDAQFYVDGLQYEDIVPPKMRAYYNFPIITTRTESIRPKIGVISLGGYYRLTDLERYWTEKCGLTGVRPLVTDRVVGNHVIPVFERDIYSLENTLDIEIIGGFCPNADIYFYSAENSVNGYYDAFDMAIQEGMDIVSTSWGQSEDIFYGNIPGVLDKYNQLFKNGVTGYGGQLIINGKNHYVILTAASGDYGSSDNVFSTYDVSQHYPLITSKVPVPHADFPASSPWMVACGGTSLYWDKTIPDGNQESTWIFGGGGQSSYFARPSYQGPWRSNWPVAPLCKRDANGQPFARTIPDIVFNGDPNSPWIIIFDGYDDEGAGTSICAPIMAALLGEFYVGSKNERAAPRNGYFGEGFNVNMYRAGTSTAKRLFLGYNVTVDRDPITNEINPFGYFGAYPDGTPVPENMTFYAIWSDYTAYSFVGGLGVPKGEQLIIYLDTVVCVAFGTHILMGNGQLKPIEQIVRGDTVIGYQNRQFKVADINRQYVSKNSTIDIIEFPPNSLGDGYPSQTLYVTPNHPIFYHGARRPAKSFKWLPNVIEHHEIKPPSILQPTMIDETGPIYYLYDLQFDDDGSYVAEGVVVQSRSPWSDITPLPKELYYEPSRYQSETHWDGFNYPLPLDERDLLP